MNEERGCRHDIDFRKQRNIPVRCGIEVVTSYSCSGYLGIDVVRVPNFNTRFVLCILS